MTTAIREASAGTGTSASGGPLDALVQHALATRFPQQIVDYSAITRSSKGDVTAEGYRLRTHRHEDKYWTVLIRKHPELPDDNRYLIRQQLGETPSLEMWHWNKNFTDPIGKPWTNPTARLHQTAMMLYDLLLLDPDNLNPADHPGTTPIQGPGVQPPSVSRMVEVTFKAAPPPPPLDRFRIWLHQGHWYEHRVEEYLNKTVIRAIESSEWTNFSVEGNQCWHPGRRVYHDQSLGLRTELETQALSTTDTPEDWFQKEFLGQSW